jgi:hypothetical protein
MDDLTVLTAPVTPPNTVIPDWTTIATVTDSSHATLSVTDNVQRQFAVSERVYYRIILTIGDGSSYASEPVDYLNGMSRRNYLRYREIVRREYLRLRKLVGTNGYLLKRRYWGPKCTDPNCLDPDTLAINRPHCPVCYGTGFTGGYFPPIPFYLDVNDASPRVLEQSEQAGTIESENDECRVIAVPAIRNYDVWVAANRNERFIFRGVKVGAAIDMLPLIILAEPRLLPPGDVVYTIPVP